MELRTREQNVARYNEIKEILEPFGFKQSKTKEHCFIHMDTRFTYDLSASDPYKIIYIVYKEAFNHGMECKRLEILKALGVSKWD